MKHLSIWLQTALLISVVGHAPIVLANTAQVDHTASILITFSRGEKRESGLINSFNPGYHRSGYQGSLHTRQLIASITRDYPVRERSGWVIDSLDVYCGLFDVAPDTDTQHLLSELAADPRIESAQPLHYYSTRVSTGYNDPYFEVQYGRASRYILGLHQRSTGRGIDIAVIDTGIDTQHPDLKEQIAETRTFLDAGVKRAVPEIHGTAMAGIIAARANNGSGIVGIAPESQIYALQACRQLEGASSMARCDSFTLARALSFAIDERVDIINLSLSGPSDPLIKRLVLAALSRGQVIAAADPGEGLQRYPALLPGVIAVREKLESGRQAAAGSGALVVQAPRKEVLSTGPGGRYDFYTGSSAATAIVSGLIALSLEYEQEMSSNDRVVWLNEAMQREIGLASTQTVSTPLAKTLLPAKSGATSETRDF